MSENYWTQLCLLGKHVFYSLPINTSESFLRMSRHKHPALRSGWWLIDAVQGCPKPEMIYETVKSELRPFLSAKIHANN